MSNKFDEHGADRAEHEAVLAEERRKLNRTKERAEAMEKHVEEFIAAALKDERNKKSLGQHGLRTMKQTQEGAESIKEFAGYGKMKDGECTGHEDRPWEKE